MPWINQNIGATAPSGTPAPNLEGGIVAPSALAYRSAGFTEKTLSSWSRHNYSVDAAILPHKRVIEGGVGDLVRNNGFVAGMRQTNVDNIIGPKGLRMSATPDWFTLGRTEEWADDWARNTDSKFRAYANNPAECDAAGLLDFADQQTVHYFNAYESGDSFSLPMWLPGRPGRKWSTAFMGIQPARVRNPLGQFDQAQFRGGIETSDIGEPTRYHIAKRNPDDNLAFGDWRNSYASDTIDARTTWGRKRIIHLLKRSAFGQTRGISPLAPLLAQFKQLELFQDYVMKQQILACLVGLIIETPVEDLIGAFGGSASDAEKAFTYLDARTPPTFNGGGQVLQLKLGEKATPMAPNIQGAQIDAFVETFMRELQAGTNLPHELLTKDFSKSSYVGIRAGLSEAARFFTSDRHWLATGFCNDFYSIWLEEAVNSGSVEAPNYYENIAAYTRCKWLGARYSFTDRVKEITASVLAIENNLSTFEEEIAFSAGEDWRDFASQRAREIQYCKDNGLPTVTGDLAAIASFSGARGRAEKMIQEPDPPAPAPPPKK